MPGVDELRRKLYEAIEKGCKHEIQSMSEELDAEIVKSAREYLTSIGKDPK